MFGDEIQLACNAVLLYNLQRFPWSIANMEQFHLMHKMAHDILLLAIDVDINPKSGRMSTLEIWYSSSEKDKALRYMSVAHSMSASFATLQIRLLILL